jgi:hypothetical protein
LVPINLVRRLFERLFHLPSTSEYLRSKQPPQP